MVWYTLAVLSVFYADTYDADLDFRWVGAGHGVQSRFCSIGCLQCIELFTDGFC